MSPARLDELRRRRAEDIAPAFGALQGRADALYVAADPLLNTNRIRVSTLAPGARLPTMHGIREYVEAGGLMSYGPNVVDQHRRAAESANVAARTLGLHTHVIHASTERNFDAAFATLLQAHAGALPPIRSSSVSAISSPHWRSNMEFPRVNKNKGDSDQAIADFNEAIRLDPKFALAFKNRGDAYGRKGDNDRAIANYGEAIRLAPNYALAFNGRAFYYFKKGDRHRAIADYNEAIRLDPKFALAFCNRGIAKLKINDASGKADIAKARQLDASSCQ